MSQTYAGIKYGHTVAVVLVVVLAVLVPLTEHRRLTEKQNRRSGQTLESGLMADLASMFMAASCRMVDVRLCKRTYCSMSAEPPK